VSLTLDHVILVVPDLDAASAELAAALSADVQYGGEHPGWGTHNAIVRMGSSYLELIAVNNLDEARRRPRGARLLEALERGPGWLGYALRADDLDDEVRQIRPRGLPIGDPQPGRRLRPDGVELRWRSASFDDAMWGGLLPFLIQHEGPVSPSTTGIAAVEVAVRDLDASVPTYAALFGREPACRGGSAIWRLPDDAEVRLTAAPDREHDGLHAVALRSLDSSRDVLGARFVQLTG
jgi:catechol 2,3-dioxygenase-like lactoylglutathione lyase family enzyme